jgi:hypothetical protein
MVGQMARIPSVSPISTLHLSTYPCPDISIQHYTKFNTRCHPVPNTRLMPGTNRFLAKPHNSRSLKTAPTSSPQPTSDASSKLSAPYFTKRAVDVTLLVALNSLAAEQSKGTENTAKAIVQVLNYCATHLDATLCYHASSMVLHIDSDASYLLMPQSCSRVRGHHYLSSNSRDPTKAPTTNPHPRSHPYRLSQTSQRHGISRRSRSRRPLR